MGRGEMGRGEMGIDWGRNGKGRSGKGRNGNKPRLCEVKGPILCRIGRPLPYWPSFAVFAVLYSTVLGDTAQTGYI